jgi:glutamate-1-semialdehyde 2,1-aminomutase
MIDETHKAKSASIKTILQKCTNAKYRYGLSGTIPKPGTLDRLTLMSFTGPVISEVTANFLQGLKHLCQENGALLIFDEVMTGFRLAKGGVQELYQVDADMVCFGKVIGGGLPVGAFAAREEIMNHLAPLGPVYQAGTLSGNPLAMAAGYEMLQYLNKHPEVFTSLEEKTVYLKNGMQEIFANTNIPFTINQVGSMISIHFHPEPVVDFTTAKNGDNDYFKKFFHGLLERGIYIAPSAYETWFLTDALTYDDLDQTLQAIKGVSKIM